MRRALMGNARLLRKTAFVFKAVCRGARHRNILTPRQQTKAHHSLPPKGETAHRRQTSFSFRVADLCVCWRLRYSGQNSAAVPINVIQFSSAKLEKLQPHNNRSHRIKRERSTPRFGMKTLPVFGLFQHPYLADDRQFLCPSIRRVDNANDRQHKEHKADKSDDAHKGIKPPRDRKDNTA